MSIASKSEAITLFLGDIVLFYAALWLALLVRYQEIPSAEVVNVHLIPFSVIFAIWILSFFIADLYDKRARIFRSSLPALMIRTQIINSVIAIAFFYFVPYFNITPKTNLFLTLVISLFLILGWRLYLAPVLNKKKRQKAILIGSGPEMKELREEFNKNKNYPITFVYSIDLEKMGEENLQSEVLDTIYKEEVSVVVVDLKNPKVTPLLSGLYNLIFSNIYFVDIHKIYEDVFDRVPLSLVEYSWFLEHISSAPKFVHDAFKRIIDIGAGIVLGGLSLLLYPFIALAIKLEDGGDIFITQKRMGERSHPVSIYKFRTMQFNEDGVWLHESENKVTKVGSFLRKTRLDELPQLWSIFKGDISLIGPRPDTIGLEERLRKEIPYYNIRYLVKPGLSGWAQIKQDSVPQTVGDNKIRLAYDLFYIKNRSFILDIKIALKTIKTLLSRKGV